MFNSTENTNTLFEKISGYIRHNKWWIIIVIVVAFCIFIFSFFLASKHYTTVTTKIYADSLHTFTITVPKNWTTEQENGTNTTGENTSHPVTQQIEISQLYVPPEEGITIQVYKDKPSCPIDGKLTTTLAGFPASYDSTIQTWTIPTSTAIVTVTISYPGSNMVHNLSMQALPVPSIVAKQNKKYILGILNTLKLTNLIPLSCQ